MLQLSKAQIKAARRRAERKAERRRQQAAQRAARDHLDRVLTFRDWCAVNSFHPATGRRLIARGEGPPTVKLSERRIGIRESDNAAWQASRVR
jgi:predicted DNA-binding transcriptional regulator AlpA